MRTIFVGCLFALLAGVFATASAQEQEKDAIQKKLESQYQLTKTTDDKSDIVTAGSVLVLQKDKLLMVAATSSANPCLNTYRDGKISPNGACKVGDKLRRFSKLGSMISADKAPSTRVFVTGEKFWLTKVDVRETGKERGIVFEFFSDAINDVRYRGALLVPFGALSPTPDEALKLAAEVVTVAPAEDAKDAKGDKQQGGQQQAQAPAEPAAPATPAPLPEPAPPPAEAAPAPIAPPPPPPADAPTVSLGQTTEQVVAELGQPVRKAKVGAKDIYFYKDMKVTFVDGKVKDIQ